MAVSGKQKWRGGSVCGCVVEVFPMVERRLKDAGVIRQSVDIYQYAYRTNVAASGNTHAGGGVLDVGQFSEAAIRIFRECGFAAWKRGPDYGFTLHGHLVLQGCPHLSSAASAQIRNYLAHENGLRDHGRDKGPQVDPITWRAAMAKYQPHLGTKYLVTAEKLYGRDGPSVTAKVKYLREKGFVVWVKRIVGNEWAETFYGTFYALAHLQRSP